MIPQKQFWGMFIDQGNFTLLATYKKKSQQVLQFNLIPYSSELHICAFILQTVLCN